MMKKKSAFYTQILELVEANGWSGDLVIIELDSSVSDSRVRVQVSLSTHHSVAPSELVNIYDEGIHSVEQVQQECLRALRTGRSGI